MSVLTKRKVLVLNKNWQPVSAVSLKKAIKLLFPVKANGTPKARIIEPESYQTFSWEDWSKFRPSIDEEQLKAGRYSFRIPEIILLSDYDKQVRQEVHFSRRNLYKRDEMTCQYCGKRPGINGLNVDHVLPRSKGGESSWTNCVLSCIDCNSRKANRTPKEAHMKLLKQPVKPNLTSFKIDGYVKPIKSWEAFISHSYWNVQLDS